MNNTQRNIGIDLLKIVSMFMIIILHLLGHGGIISSSKPLSVQHYSAWLLEVTVFCSVNCYALISGYVNCGRNHKHSNIVYLLFQVLFYTVIITILFVIFNRKTVSRLDLLKAIIPFGYGTYWYFSAYFCLFFMFPYLNRILFSFSKETLKKMIGTMIVLLSILPTLFHYDFPKTYNGYSFLWLMLMYIVGGFVKKYNIRGFINNKYNLIAYLLCVLLTWISKISIDCLTHFFLGEAKGGTYLISFTSPTIILAALFLLFYFSSISPGLQITTIAKKIAPLTFGIYLLHEMPLIRKTFIKDRFVFLLRQNSVLMIIAILGIALAIFIIGVLIDCVRFHVFNLIRVRVFCDSITKKVHYFASHFSVVIYSKFGGKQKKK